MSINNINNGLTNNAQLDNQRAAQQQTAPTANKPVAQPIAQDSVSLTQSAQNLHQLQNKAFEAPVNQEKVEQLRTSILNGEYRIDPEALASKIAKMETQIFGF
jgi:negative regulator of flagellin synthesis FlgM